MSQAPVILPGSPLTGAAAAADMNAAWAAMISMFSGTTAPTLGPGASGALVVGQDWLNTSITPYIWNKWDGVTWTTVGFVDPALHYTYGPLAYRNIVGDNGGLEVWQRGAGSSASFAVGASTTSYTADRWYLATGANQACVVAAVTGLTALSRLAAKVTRNNGQTGTGALVFAYPLDTDEIVRMRGQKMNIQFQAKAGANWSPAGGTLSYSLYVGTGAVGKRGSTPYTGETQAVSGSLSLNSSQQLGTTTAGTVIVPANATQAELQIAWTPVGTAGADDSITIDDVQLEAGAQYTIFERPPFDKLLLSCKRHFWKTFLYGTAPVTNAGTFLGEVLAMAGKIAAGSEFLWVRNPVSMRVAPTLTLFNPSANNAHVRDESNSVDCSAESTTQTTEMLAIGTTGNASTTVGSLLGVNLTADAGI